MDTASAAFIMPAPRPTRGSGVGIGALCALGLTRAIQALLFGVSASDPLTLLSVAALLAAVAGVACFIPARRATRIDPLVALRED